MYLPTNNGLGCGGLGCDGMGALSMDGSGVFGTGVFGTGVTLTDFSTWSAYEIGAVAVGLYVLFSVMSTTSRGAHRVSSTTRKATRSVRSAFSGEERRKKKAEELREQARKLEGPMKQKRRF